jgi:hypothetical protein
MNSRLQQLVQNKIFRWLMSVMILFYVLVPQVGACYCSGCRFKEHHDSSPATMNVIVEESKESTESTSCCSQKKSQTPVSIANVSTTTVTPRSCCSRIPVENISSDLADLVKESPVCPCSVKQTPDQPNFILPPTILLRQSLDELLPDDSLLCSFFVSVIPVVKTVSFYQCYETPVSRLPVRLHLLLLVLLN